MFLWLTWISEKARWLTKDLPCRKRKNSSDNFLTKSGLFLMHLARKIFCMKSVVSKSKKMTDFQLLLYFSTSPYGYFSHSRKKGFVSWSEMEYLNPNSGKVHSVKFTTFFPFLTMIQPTSNSTYLKKLQTEFDMHPCQKPSQPVNQKHAIP